MYRGYATLEIKSFDAEQRVIEGIASTPTPDRCGDVLVPAGAQFALPMPLLWQHDQAQPIGDVFEAAITPAGIAIKARIASIDEPGVLRDRLEYAWQSIKAKLVRGLSIGWRPITYQPLPKGGLHVSKWLWAELSAVTIPQNVDATILAVKSADLAASGRHLPGAPGPLPIVRAIKVAPAMTIQDQIKSYETTRAAKFAKQTELMTKAADAGVTLDAAQTEEYDTLGLEVKSIDAHLVRLRELETLNAKAAQPIPADPLKPAPAPVIQVHSVLPKGTAFVRYCKAIAACRGNRMEAAEWAKQWHDSTPEVELALKAATAAATTTDATWAGPLAPIKPLANEFLELLRPATILGKIDNFLKVPFNVSVPAQTGGGTYGWVGQGAPKPVTKAAFGTVIVTITKTAGIIVITEELARNSTPDAEAVMQREMIGGMSQFLDQQFIDPTVAAVAGVSPGSVTNGVTPITSAGSTPANARTDVVALMNAMAAANIPVTSAVLIMSETNALALTAALNALGQPLWPNMTPTGGVGPLGIKVVTSQTAGSTVALVSAPCILYADDGGVSIDISREASVQMDSAPDNPAIATTVLTSLWQNNLVGLRAERFINWKKARAGCVQYTTATYNG